MKHFLRLFGISLPILLGFQMIAGALDDLRRKAEAGDAIAQYNLGLCYDKGEKGVAKDAAEAAKWWRKAAEQGFANAQNNLGTMYAHGEGVAKDTAEAAKWYRMAANQGLANSQYNLGLYYAKGESGVAKDASEAVKWYRMAADQGFASAQTNLGFHYANGVGVPKDFTEALKWYRMAADQGDAGAQSNIGKMYVAGEGVPKDATEAVTWWRKAAEQGNVDSQLNLGLAYAKGQGVPKDLVEAYKWVNLAAAADLASAISLRLILEKDMTPSQIAEAQRLSREFKPGQATPSNGVSGIAGRQAQSEGGDKNRAKSSGSGFLVTTDGHIVTSAHVLLAGRKPFVVTQSGTLPATVLRSDPANDLAVLKVDGTFSPLPVISSRAVKLGEPAFTVGFPNPSLQGFSPKFTKGEISSLTGPRDDPRYFQISLPIQPGNSGGALVDSRGNVVGVIAAKLGSGAAVLTTGALPENVNYGVKSSFLTALLESLPAVSTMLMDPNTKARSPEEIAQMLQAATVLVFIE